MDSMTVDELYTLIKDAKAMINKKERSDKEVNQKYLNDLFEEYPELVESKILETVSKGLENVPMLCRLTQHLKYGETCEHFIINYMYKGQNVSFGIYTVLFRDSVSAETEYSFVTDLEDHKWCEFGIPDYLKSDVEFPTDFIEEYGFEVEELEKIPEALWALKLVLGEYTDSSSLRFPIEESYSD